MGVIVEVRSQPASHDGFHASSELRQHACGPQAVSCWSEAFGLRGISLYLCAQMRRVVSGLAVAESSLRIDAVDHPTARRTPAAPSATRATRQTFSLRPPIFKTGSAAARAL
jgi:hypothetical protein